MRHQLAIVAILVALCGCGGDGAVAFGGEETRDGSGGASSLGTGGSQAVDGGAGGVGGASSSGGAAGAAMMGAGGSGGAACTGVCVDNWPTCTDKLDPFAVSKFCEARATGGQQLYLCTVGGQARAGCILPETLAGAITACVATCPPS